MKKDTKRIKCHVKTLTEKVDISNNGYTDIADVRRKRIEIVFKIIYVVAVLGAYSLVLVSKSFSNGLTDNYILFTCVTSFLICMLIYLLIYVFNELKCLRVNQIDVPKNQEKKTECSYSSIFEYIIQGGCTILICYVFVLYCRYLLTPDRLLIVCEVSMAITLACANSPWKKYRKIFEGISHVFCTIMVFCILISMAFVEV